MQLELLNVQHANHIVGRDLKRWSGPTLDPAQDPQQHPWKVANQPLFEDPQQRTISYFVWPVMLLNHFSLRLAFSLATPFFLHSIKFLGVDCRFGHSSKLEFTKFTHCANPFRHLFRFSLIFPFLFLCDIQKRFNLLRLLIYMEENASGCRYW